MKKKTEEIRMEITSAFVKKHEFWVNHVRGKNWIARITGLDRVYGYRREFLQMVHMGQEKVFQLTDFVVDGVYEVASEYFTGSGKKSRYLRDTFVCREITETHVVLEWISQEEVVRRFAEENGVTVAESLAKQLLRIVSPRKAKALIETISGEVIQ